MPEGLSTEDGTAIDLDGSEREFARAMAAPEPDEPEHPAPPKRVELSEEELGEKFGWITNPDGSRRAKRAKGRPSTKARTVTPPPVADKSAKPAGKGKDRDPGPAPDFTQPLSELTSACWMVLAAAPVPVEPLRVKLRAQAKILRENQGGVVQGVAIMAAHNGVIRRGVESLTMGSAGWVLPATMALAPFAVQSMAVWRAKPEDLAELAAQTEQEWKDEFEAMSAAMGIGPARPGAGEPEQAAA